MVGIYYRHKTHAEADEAQSPSWPEMLNKIRFAPKKINHTPTSFLM
jgi:hypothetical protein